MILQSQQDCSSIKAIEIIRDDQNLQKQPIENAERFCKKLGIKKNQTNIVPFIIPNINQLILASVMTLQVY